MSVYTFRPDTSLLTRCKTDVSYPITAAVAKRVAVLRQEYAVWVRAYRNVLPRVIPPLLTVGMRFELNDLRNELSLKRLPWDVGSEF